jgi:hypothetical protein
MIMFRQEERPMNEARPTVTEKSGEVDVLRRYADILLCRMTQDDQQELTLTESGPLPDPFTPPAKELPEGIDYQAVVGQLQFMTHGCDPNAELAAESECEIKLNGRPFDLAVSVHDASCKVSLTPRG